MVRVSGFLPFESDLRNVLQDSVKSRTQTPDDSAGLGGPDERLNQSSSKPVSCHRDEECSGGVRDEDCTRSWFFGNRQSGRRGLWLLRRSAALYRGGGRRLLCERSQCHRIQDCEVGVFRSAAGMGIWIFERCAVLYRVGLFAIRVGRELRVKVIQCGVTCQSPAKS